MVNAGKLGCLALYRQALWEIASFEKKKTKLSHLAILWSLGKIKWDRLSLSSVLDFSSVHAELPSSGSQLSICELSCLIKQFSFLKNFIFNWRIGTLQYYDGFCHTSTQISHRYTRVLPSWTPSHLPSHPIPSGCHRAPAPSALRIRQFLKKTCAVWSCPFTTKNVDGVVVLSSRLEAKMQFHEDISRFYHSLTRCTVHRFTPQTAWIKALGPLIESLQGTLPLWPLIHWFSSTPTLLFYSVPSSSYQLLLMRYLSSLQKKKKPRPSCRKQLCPEMQVAFIPCYFTRLKAGEQHIKLRQKTADWFQAFVWS